ncbi:MAG TPA: SIS domain-containing protein [Ktedonobacterales bacterium]
MDTTKPTTSALYRSILTQPAVIRAVVEDAAGTAAQAAGVLASADRIFLTGTGTSSHAAVVGEHLLRMVGVDAYATTAFDFATYPRPLRHGDALVAISHRGTKRYGALAITHAREAGIPIVGLTGRGSPMDGADVVVETAPPETSSTHSASYTANLAALALIAAHVGERRGADVTPLRAALATLPDMVSSLLARDDAVRSLAEALATRGRLVLVGAGPNAVTAREGALKVKESSYLVAEGFELETLLHGALPAVEPGDVAVAIAAHGPALERTCDAIRALGLIGAHLLVVADERVVVNLPADTSATVIAFAPVPEPLSPLLAVIPLQLLAAFTADLRHTDADSFRNDDPVHKRANDSYTL